MIARRVNALKARLEKDGWLVVLPGRTHSIDLIAMKPEHHSMFLAVRAGGKAPLARFSDESRRRFLGAANTAGAVAFLVWCPEPGQEIWLAPNEWA